MNVGFGVNALHAEQVLRNLNRFRCRRLLCLSFLRGCGAAKGEQYPDHPEEVDRYHSAEPPVAAHSRTAQIYSEASPTHFEHSQAKNQKCFAKHFGAMQIPPGVARPFRGSFVNRASSARSG